MTFSSLTSQVFAPVDFFPIQLSFIFNYTQAQLENSLVACKCEEEIQVEPMVRIKGELELQCVRDF